MKGGSLPRPKRTPLEVNREKLHQTQLSQDTLTSNQLSGDADCETQHGQATIPVFSKLSETKLSLFFSHVETSLLQGMRGKYVPVTKC